MATFFCTQCLYDQWSRLSALKRKMDVNYKIYITNREYNQFMLDILSDYFMYYVHYSNRPLLEGQLIFTEENDDIYDDYNGNVQIFLRHVLFPKPYFMDDDLLHTCQFII
jgi:hypothetical protein